MDEMNDSISDDNSFFRVIIASKAQNVSLKTVRRDKNLRVPLKPLIVQNIISFVLDEAFTCRTSRS
jgi:hypothetical protein